jgi:hypothetical protein
MPLAAAAVPRATRHAPAAARHAPHLAPARHCSAVLRSQQAAGCWHWHWHWHCWCYYGHALTSHVGVTHLGLGRTPALALVLALPRRALALAFTDILCCCCLGTTSRTARAQIDFVRLGRRTRRPCGAALLIEPGYTLKTSYKNDPYMPSLVPARGRDQMALRRPAAPPE